MKPVIVFENVHYTYPGDELESLCGIDLAIEQGSFVAVLGHNGSGKSTLAKHMNAILTPTEGKVWVAGMDSSDEEKLLDGADDPDQVYVNEVLPGKMEYNLEYIKRFNFFYDTVKANFCKSFAKEHV